MNEALEPVCSALEELAQAIITHQGDDRLMIEWLGWQFPPLSRHDLAQYPASLAARIRAANPEAVSSELLALLQSVPHRLQKIREQFVPRFFNGEVSQVIGPYLLTMEWLRTALASFLDWQVIEDPQAAPPKLARRLRTLDARLKSLEPNMGELEKQIETIRQGYAAADSLPADLQSLQEARDEVSRLREASSKFAHEIEGARFATQLDTDAMKSLLEEAKRIVAQCGEAYRATTSIGLAAAFDERTKRLGVTMWIPN